MTHFIISQPRATYRPRTPYTSFQACASMQAEDLGFSGPEVSRYWVLNVRQRRMFTLPA